MKFSELLTTYSIPFRDSGHEHCRPGWLQIDCPFCSPRSEHTYSPVECFGADFYPSQVIIRDPEWTNDAGRYITAPAIIISCHPKEGGNSIEYSYEHPTARFEEIK